MDSSEVHKPVPKGKPEGKHRGKVDTAIPTTAATSSKEVARTGPLEPLQGTKGSATTGPSILQLKWGQANTPVHGAAKPTGPKGRFVDTPADLLDETAGVQAAADVPMSEVTPPLEQKETMQVGSSRAVEASSDDELLDLSRLGLEEEGDPNGSPFLQ
ncbi:hypothetical protein K1T71_002568 [Dendrolimus kikuchii]|uniref:Uncharacterized protein n=3 Tax=Dendrolimus kikuchii TaxID=765133 RepID=A0ACC1DD35_9NEOP|nr:hypothetical protein K1T71_014755 [Dendrolimus kikuchii]KAJ0177986.1 hypothetical protein K1T71_006859 [Dendrolimus kikuchii]KAJ0181527.1 hypothetical protein K1T71_002249 [Dendrolimus kikuchii]KAJ0181846.1 hypothetical protein K1T71_002568 [Dendrolimus kikuchii]